MSDEAYLRIRRFRRPSAGLTPPRMVPALGACGYPMGHTLPPPDEPYLSVKIDGETIGINKWEDSDDYISSPGWPLEARRDYVIEPGEHLLELVVRRFHSFESRKAGYASCRFSVEPGGMYTVTCQYNGYIGWLFLIPEENFEIDTFTKTIRKVGG